MSIADAIATLRAALLNDDDQAAQSEALGQLGNLLAELSAKKSPLFAHLALQRAQLPKQPGGLGEPTASLLAMLHEDTSVFQAVVWLLRFVEPQWLVGGELRSDAPPVDAIAEHVLAAIDGDAIDANGYAAVLLGRYGPDAEELLPALLERLRANRTNCSRAPGLTWSVYMIGGLRPAVRELMIEIVTKADSCPHSKKLATRILRMNQVET